MKPILTLCAQPLFESRGSPIRVKAFLRALGRSQVRVDVITLPIGPNYPLPEGVRLFRVPNVLRMKSIVIGPSVPKLFFGGLIALKGLFRSLSRKYSTIHGIEEMGIPAWILARISGARFIFEKHSDPLSYRSKSPLRNAVMQCYAAIERFTWRRADVIIVTGPGLADLVKSSGTRAAVHVIDDVPSSEQRADPKRIPLWRSRFGCLPREKVCAYIGSFAGYQGVPLFLEAVRKALPAHPQLRVVLVGGSEEDAQMVRLAGEESGCPDRLVHIDRIGADEVPDFLLACDVLVSPRLEGSNTPLKVLDYLRSGRSILAVDSEANRQILDPSVAYLVPSTSESLANGMGYLLSNKELRAKLGRAGRRRFKTRFGVVRFQRDLLKAFSPTVAKPRQSFLHRIHRNGSCHSSLHLLNDASCFIHF